MRPRDERLLRVLHDPVAYYRPWAARADALLPRQRSALNAWLARCHALPPYAPGSPAQDLLVDRLLGSWERVPRVAWLMACARQRRWLAASPLYLQQPPQVHAFLRLGLAEDPPPPVPLRDADTLMAHGGAVLLHGLADRIPGWLRARMALWFHGLPPPPGALRRTVPPFDPTCFWSAWTHAADLPGSVAGLRR